MATLRTNECGWLKEIQQPRVQNCLKDDTAFWKLLFTHRQVEKLMEAADVEQSVKYHTLAVDLRNVCVQGKCHGVLTVLKGIARRRDNLLRRIMVWPNMICLGGQRCSSEACKDFEANGLNARRLLLQKEVFEKVAEQKTAECMLVELKHAFVECLRQLRVSDTDRLYMDRKHGSFVSENSNVWIWAQIVRS